LKFLNPTISYLQEFLKLYQNKGLLFFFFCYSI